MRNFAWVTCVALIASGCGSLVKDRSQVPLTPIGGFGSALGSRSTHPPSTGQDGNGPAEWRNADVITLDLPALIGRYTSAAGARPASFEEAVAAFDRSAAATSPDIQTRRNAVVGAILMASDKNCDVYLEYLHGNQITLKAVSSAGATLLSGAATVTTPERSSKLLAAIGSAFSGVGGNLNEAFFSNRAVEVIASGIRADRAVIRQNIDTRMASSSAYQGWTLTAALADAMQYHGRCNAISGLAYLQGEAERSKATAEKARAGISEGRPEPTPPSPPNAQPGANSSAPAPSTITAPSPGTAVNNEE